MNPAERILRTRYLARKAEVANAMQYFKKRWPSEFAVVAVAIHDGIEERKRTAPQFFTHWEEQLKAAISIMDLQSDAFLRLVADMESHGYYTTVVQSFGNIAVESCFGVYGMAAYFSGKSQQEQEVARRTEHWINEGFRKLAKQNIKPDEKNDGVGEALPDSERARLLAEYKEANDNVSNKRIYEAKNSGIHKPQFYEWIKGVLPSESETAKNFERFLREKKPPMPRKSKS
jgi:hypothetical protein